MHNRDFLERMAIGKANAKAKRDDGTGIAHKSWKRARRPDPAAGTWERAVAEHAAYWASARDQAIADVVSTLYGNEWEGM